LKVNRLRVNYNSKIAEDIQANLTYVTSGLGWAPSYKIDLDIKKKVAKLMMKSVIINDAEDINAEELVCAAGLPVMKYGHVFDPLISRNDVHKFISELHSHHISTVNQEERSISRGQTSRSSNSDFIYYKFKNVTINKNNRISLPVLESDINYTDVYHCHITEREERNQENLPKVWHAIKLNNNTRIPWTSGTIMITENGNFIGHTSITRNPIGGDALVDIAEALDIKISFTKTTQEVDRSTKNFLGTDQASIFNSTEEEIKVFLTRDFYGKPISSEGNAAITTEHELGTNLNFKNTICWEIFLQPGETKQIKQTYSFVLDKTDQK